MGELLIFLALNSQGLAMFHCPYTKMENASKYPWNKHDLETLEYAKRRCPELDLDAPCVKLFRKFDYQDYSVICGKEL